MKSEKIFLLVVEDSLPLMERMLYLFEGVSEIEFILHAANSSETLRTINEMPVDVVLLDINLPDGNGIDILKKIKEIRPETKVVMFTNYAAKAFRDACYKLGADGFLEKSSDFEKVPQMITNLFFNNNPNPKTVKLVC